MSDSVLRRDLIRSDLLEDQQKVKVFSEVQFNKIVERAIQENKTTSALPAKDIIEVMDLIYYTIQDYETRTGKRNDAKINLVYEDPDTDINLETISIMFTDRIPGMFGQGRPFENKVQNKRPVLREIFDDPDNPGYKRAVLGYFYDNIITLTCWARTNKTVNQRALWLENLMEEYAWFFSFSGVNRILFDSWGKNKIITIGNNKHYGRPLNYFVRTEKLQNVSQKTLEQICIRVTASSYNT